MSEDYDGLVERLRAAPAGGQWSSLLHPAADPIETLCERVGALQAEVAMLRSQLRAADDRADMRTRERDDVVTRLTRKGRR